MDTELLQDSNGVNESFWDGLGVEFEAKYFLEGIWGCGGSRTIENFSRIKMVVARASGTDLASSLKRNTFLALEMHPAGRAAQRYTKPGSRCDFLFAPRTWFCVLLGPGNLDK